VRLLGSGAILREVIAAAELLEQDFGVAAEIWSVTSFNELRREGLDISRWNNLHPDKKPKTSYVASVLKEADIPVVAATDYMKIYADQIREFIPARYTVLGTDGYGRSDTRARLRKFFEVNRYHVVVAGLNLLRQEGKIPASKVAAAMNKYNIDPDKPNPVTV